VGADWIHEIKRDGFRLLAWRDDERVRLVLNKVFIEPGEVVFKHACALGCEGIVSKRRGSRYVSGRSRDWLKHKNPAAPAVRREVEEDWGNRR
jgi:ATP-dependent DNA ligase